MKRANRIAGAIVIACMLAPPLVHADDDYKRSFPLWLTAQGGSMFPSGRKGSGLRKGPQFVGSLSYELSPSFVLSGDLGYAASTDRLRTRFLLIGLSGRLNPNPDLRRLYALGGAALYNITYDPKSPALSAPPTKLRPGLSFGIGYDALELGNIALGLIGSYHGVVTARSAGFSYVTLGAYASLRPTWW